MRSIEIEALRRPPIEAPNEGAMRGRIFTWLLADVIPKRDTLLDLGAGHCLFSMKARDAGYRVTAVDGRAERVPEDLGERIEFVQSDVRDFDPSGFDVVAVLGLLYHLTLEDQQSLLRRCAGSTVVVDTQVHVPRLVTHKAGAWADHVVWHGDYEGVVFPENDNPMASIGNAQSFWHTESSLLRLFEATGFSRVLTVEPEYPSKYGARKFYVLS